MWIAPFEVALAAFTAVVIWLRRVPVLTGVLVGLMLLAELWVVRQWLFSLTTARLASDRTKENAPGRGARFP